MGAPLLVLQTSESVFYRRSTAVVSRQISGETLVVPIRGKVGDLASIYSFNETGSVLWAELERPRTLQDLAGALCRSFAVEKDQAWQDAQAFVSEMQAVGLLSSGGAVSS
jgi:Coenzyme PQQ synthesis protein D (PqqD)